MCGRRIQSWLQRVFRVKIMVDMTVVIEVLPSEDMRALVGVMPMY